MKKREFLRLTGLAAAGVAAAPLLTFCGSDAPSRSDASGGKSAGFEPFALPLLPFASDALEPYIDARTMDLHYGKHHAGYVKKLNATLEDHPDLHGKSLEALMAVADDSEKNTALRNNGGGHYNHSLFWEILTPGGSNRPAASLQSEIKTAFGSFDSFKEEFSKAAAGVFGSGWAWLCRDENGLFIAQSENQDNPLMAKIAERTGKPLLGLDVWEHAYYLNYQNRRAEYIDGFFNLINWDAVSQRYAE